MRKIALYASGALIVLAAAAAIASGYLYFYSQRPHARFVLNMAGLRAPAEFTEREVTLDVKGRRVPVLMFTKQGAPGGRYMMLLHGFSPEAHRDPRMKKLAVSICDGTGLGVFIPRVDSFFRGKLAGGEVTGEIAETYTALARAYPGRYYAFGACLGATVMVVALQKVPAELYPKKLLLFGPITDGKALLKDHSEKRLPGQDIILKLVVTANMEIFSEKEKSLIRTAMMNAGTGRTDESRIKRILGERLFHDISIVNLKNSDIEAVTPESMAGAGAVVPDSRFYILHSRNDTIVPSVQGRGISDVIRGRGGRAPYLETGLFSHADSNITAGTFVGELRYMLSFFADFFAEEN